jgi:hypothetical protein
MIDAAGTPPAIRQGEFRLVDWTTWHLWVLACAVSPAKLRIYRVTHWIPALAHILFGKPHPLFRNTRRDPDRFEPDTGLR